MPTRTRRTAAAEPSAEEPEAVRQRRERGGEDRTITGNLVRMGDLEHDGEGKPKLHFTLAKDRWRQAGDRWEKAGTDFYNVTAKDRLAEGINASRQGVKPGTALVVEGFLFDPSTYIDERTGATKVSQNNMVARAVGVSMRDSLVTAQRITRQRDLSTPPALEVVPDTEVAKDSLA